ncbi:2-phosphosulfolactate phosphatase [Nocardioides sp. cx-169]|uniref:2-phosphosulfolactate phosphatase n=1 Tax=Nocardioides sp. cx-169 TaxID=2899080 RepID=UPI001E5CDA9B|nr:2-phosphosulfolactate phosphatase [Nocardioides sp. cx-169]MCD4532974.1 2-phosphosulfolactate phosphatase [Nocardioides sp. cx-169]
MTDPHGQQEHAVRLEWGPTGGTAVAAGADVAVVVDVLSFTTTLTVAVERGMAVHPFAWKDERASEHAAELGAVLAIGRFEEPAAGLPAVSLSAAAMSRVEGVDRIVLPSPNGSAICAALAGSALAGPAVTVVGACLRNRTAVARWLAPRVADGAVVAVVPAGERWPDGSMRPGAEDLWGAGAVVDAMVRLGATGLSLEATHARDAFRAARATLRDGLLACASGKELVAAGFAEDVEVAAGLDVSDVVPALGEDGAFRAAR